MPILKKFFMICYAKCFEHACRQFNMLENGINSDKTEKNTTGHTELPPVGWNKNQHKVKGIRIEYHLILQVMFLKIQMKHVFILNH